jgi:hypothetical protein
MKGNTMNDPKNWSTEVRLRGDELSLLLDALEELGDACSFEGADLSKEINALARKLTAKWEANA